MEISSQSSSAYYETVCNTIQRFLACMETAEHRALSPLQLYGQMSAL